MKKETGITLLALVITIIVLLILAGITIGAITGDNGIIQNALSAKEQTEIANEKEIVEKATVQAMGNSKYGNIEESELQSELDKETGEGKTEAIDIGDAFEVVFNDSNRYYTVDKDGNIGEAQEIIEDKNPGDITIGKDGEELDGSEEKPYEISCIEDLVAFSNLSRGKGNYIENGEIKDATKDTFSGDTIILTKNLNFNSAVSYADLSMKWRYDQEEEAYVIDENSTQNLRDLLIDRNGVGFVPIGEDSASENLDFSGIFDGQNYEIQNLYENTEKAGLFEKINATIKNLGLVNVDMIATGNSGGISSAYYSSKLYNIYVSGNITGKNVGGIVGNGGGSTEFINCCNLANIQGTEGVAGIVKYADTGTNINIVNCYNAGEIIGMGTSASYHAVSGIIGAAYNRGTRKIINSCSIGTISKPKGSAQNFYYAWDATPFELQNCYYLDSIINEKVIANENSIAFSKGDESVINKLNTYAKEHKNDYAIELYTWKLDSNGLPTFEK